jgi:hypothetical protein
MKTLIKFIAVTACLMSATPSLALDAWGKRQVAYHTLNAIDTIQTCHILQSGKGYELNPIFGKNPDCGTLVAAKLGGSILHQLIASELRKRDEGAAKLFQIMTIGVQGGVVAWNFTVVF